MELLMDGLGFQYFFVPITILGLLFTSYLIFKELFSRRT